MNSLGDRIVCSGSRQGTDQRRRREAHLAAAHSLGAAERPRFNPAEIAEDWRGERPPRPSAKIVEAGFRIMATGGTASYLSEHGVEVEKVNKVKEGRPHIVDMIKNEEISLIVNTTEGKQAIRESRSIRAEAVRNNITYYTTLGAAIATGKAIEHLDDSDVNRLQDLHKEVAA